ncbi:MAG: PBSX family phage terminase large subunit [Oscillospiraceae bacterium]|nr:PBSX family phage terminase large subunit [Oscillospiraceae bacterium]
MGVLSLSTISLKSMIAPSFYETHKAIKDGLTDEVLEKGGRGSTKSSFISIELILQLINHPECHAVVLRKVANTLRTSVYAQVCWAITELGLGSKFRCTVSPMECVYKQTGQKIMFFGMDDPGKLKSIKVPFGYIGLAWFEELDQFSGPEEVRSVEQSILRGGAYSLTFKSFNPPAMARNWANRYALESKPGKRVHHSTYIEAPPEWLGPRFLADAEHLKRTNETAYLHEYMGEVVGCGTQVFDNLQLKKITDKEIEGFDRILNGVDWGWYPDPFAFCRMHYDAARKNLYIFDEIRVHKMRNNETAELVKAKILPEEIVIADSAEKKSVSDYRALGIRCRDADKGPGSVQYSMKWLQSLGSIVIDPERCPHTAKEFSEYEYERDKKTGEILEGYPDVANHHIDAVRYATNQIWKRRGQ